MLVHRKITYKLYPSEAQIERLTNLLHLHKNLYNAALEERISAYQKSSTSLNYYDQAASLSAIRQFGDTYQSANNSALQQTLRRLNKAFSAFFRRVKKSQKPGFPRFKSITRFPGITYGSFNKGKSGWRFQRGNDWKHGKLLLSDVGSIKARGKARTGGDLIHADVCYRRDHWWLSLTVACEPKRECKGTVAVGMDWGVSTFLSLVDADGNTREVENPRWFQQYKEAKAELQRALSAKKRFSRAWRQIKCQLAALESAIARRRLDWQHKLSSELVEQYPLLAIEKLTVKNMTRSAKGTTEKPGKQVAQKAGLNREILDTAPSQFYQMLSAKAAEAASIFLETPTRTLKPSQRCPACWKVARKTLSERVHQCASCQHTEPRDLASSRVNLLYALDWVSGREPTCPA